MIRCGERPSRRECLQRISACSLMYVPRSLFLPLSERILTVPIDQVLVGTIRSEIADCSEKAYPSLPISNAKNLLFLESEGAVIEFAQQRGWVLRDGRIYFPVEPEAAARSEKDILVASTAIIENAIGYARELETIV